jgi:hypothetical protein
LIRARTTEERARAKARGVNFKLTPAKRRQALAILDAGETSREIARPLTARIRRQGDWPVASTISRAELTCFPASARPIVNLPSRLYLRISEYGRNSSLSFLLDLVQMFLTLETFRIDHLPIVDVSIPDEQFEREWVVAGEELRSILRRRLDVLVHCRGGLGRAGTIAARLLIELGMEPTKAIERVRAVRPGAIETPDQERFVRGIGADHQ